jgi:hypothetical protein
MSMNMQLFTSRIDTPNYQIGYFNHITRQSCIRRIVSSEMSMKWKQDIVIRATEPDMPTVRGLFAQSLVY